MESPDYVVSKDILYADDTVLLGNETWKLQAFLDCIVDYDHRYGLHINWDKTSVININCDSMLFDTNGTPIKQVDSIIYLGSSIRADGNHSSEFSRRIGEATQIFNKLER
eukprot:2839394-Karenia_brevis.AAC.1